MHNLMQKDTVTIIVPLSEIDAVFLQKHGPLLLCEFPLCDDFCSDEGHLVHELSYCDASAEHAVHPNPAPGRCVMRGDYRRDDGTCTKYHAMLIIGVRGAGAARRFLVRNSWRRHQFVEVSLAYLEWRRPILHGPSAYAVCTPQLAVPAGFAGTAQAAAPYAEAGQIDARQPREF